MIISLPAGEYLTALNISSRMMAEKGRQFDPQLVDLLLGNLPEIQRLYDRLKDW
jgi:response regulator RpfG family c-di-GMP phosphodiesterase